MAWTRYRYVVLNTVISLIAFGRNILFMRTLGIEDLAQVALMQTLVMLIGFVQIGMLNGAYIGLAEKDAANDRRIVDQVWTVLGLFTPIIALGIGLGLCVFLPGVIAQSTVLYGSIAGLITLISTFLNNSLVAHGQLDRANTIGLIAVSISLGLGMLSAFGGLIYAQLALISQPLMLVISVLVSTPRLRPAALTIDRDTLSGLLRIGLPAFMAMIFLLLSYQLERWTIVFVLGEAALGRFYLVIMYMNFFVLLPASVLNMHIPPALRALRDGSKEELRKHSIAHLRALGVFILLIGTLTYFALQPILRLGMPQFEADAYLVYLVFPVMVLFILRDNASLIFFAIKRTKALVYMTGAFFGTYAVLISVLVATASFSLETLLFARGAAAMVCLVVAVVLRRRVLAEVV